MSEPIDVSVAQDGGIMKTIIEAAPEGALGPPPNGMEVTAHYTGESTYCVRCVELGWAGCSFVVLSDV
jgi:hypothetical protein